MTLSAVPVLQVSEALQKNQFLTSLDLSCNRITDGGTEVRVKHLPECLNPGRPSSRLDVHMSMSWVSLMSF